MSRSIVTDHPAHQMLPSIQTISRNKKRSITSSTYKLKPNLSICPSNPQSSTTKASTGTNNEWICQQYDKLATQTLPSCRDSEIKCYDLSYKRHIMSSLCPFHITILWNLLRKLFKPVDRTAKHSKK